VDKLGSIRKYVERTNGRRKVEEWNALLKFSFD
jgi:hypothetical protein